MPYHLRFQSQRWATHHITSRCLQGFDLLKPTTQVNAVIRGVLCYSAHFFKDVIHLHYTVFLSNHFHMIVSADETGDLSDFMKHFKGNLARELNRVHNRRGPFWEKRFSSEEILDEEGLRDAIKYLTKNSVKEGLVDHPRQWAGIHSYQQLVDGQKLKGKWLNRSELKEAQTQHKNTIVNEIDFTTEYTLKLHAPPFWCELDEDEYLRIIKELCEEAVQEAYSCRQSSAMGMEMVLAQDVNKPRYTKSSPRPLCRTMCLKRRQQYRQLYCAFKIRFKEAMSQLCEAIIMCKEEIKVTFPEGGVPPLWKRTQKSIV